MQARGVVRASVLRRWLERGGLVAVRQQSFPRDTWAPLSPVEREGTVGLLCYFAAVADGLALPAADRAFWRAQADPTHPDALINHPAFYHRFGYVLAVGRVPPGA